jgi:hypothetical protein
MELCTWLTKKRQQRKAYIQNMPVSTYHQSKSSDTRDLSRSYQCSCLQRRKFHLSATRKDHLSHRYIVSHRNTQIQGRPAYTVYHFLQRRRYLNNMLHWQQEWGPRKGRGAVDYRAERDALYVLVYVQVDRAIAGRNRSILSKHEKEESQVRMEGCWEQHWLSG